MKFYRLPKILLKEAKYRKLSCTSLIIYAIMLDRVSLSEQNGWRDEEGRTYINFTKKEAAEILGISRQSVINHFEKLKEVGLYYEKPNGLFKNRVYVNNFTPECQKSLHTGVKKLDTNKTNINNTDINKTYPPYQKGKGEGEDFSLSAIKEKCELEIWHDQTGKLIEDAISELYYSKSFTAKNKTYSQKQIRKILSELDADCIIYTVGELKKINADIKKPDKYFKSALLNSKKNYLASELICSR